MDRQTTERKRRERADSFEPSAVVGTGGTRNAAPPRVLIIAPSLDMLGGQSRQAALMIEHLRKDSSLEISFLPVNPRLPRLLKFLQTVKYARTVPTTLLYWVSLLTNVWKHDVIHIFSASYYSYMLSVIPAICVSKLFGKKTILNYRSGEAEDHLRNWRTAIPTIRLADEIVVPSGYLVDLFASFGLRARAIFDIVDFSRFIYRERKPMRPVFFTSRLLEPLYNIPCVLRAFALIQKQFPEASLTVAGEGWQRAELEALAGTLGLRNTKFIGGVPFEKMPATYDAADIYLTATNLDNMPGSITECLASGLPVVTTDAGGIPYIVKHEETCLMIQKNDHEAMAASAIRLLADNDLALKIARQGRESCRRFTWEGVESDWLKLYHGLAREDEKGKAENLQPVADASRQIATGREH